jgi:iron complex transport system substrate-binding protein
MLLPTAGLWALPPQRVMSINLCSDQLLLDLLPSERITSVTYLSREPYESYMSDAAWRVGVNHGMAEEVVRERPDLVLAGLYTAPATRQLLKAVGIPVLEMEPANTFDEIRNQTRQLGRILGVEERAEQLIQKMDAKLKQLSDSAPRQPITIIAWEGAGFVPGKGTLTDAIFSAAGAINLGASPGLRIGRFDAEALLLKHPDLLAYGNADVAAPSLHSASLNLSVIQRQYVGRQIVYPELLYSCGLPQSADAAIQIRQMMLKALQ